MDWEYESQDLKVAYLKLRENFQQFTHRLEVRLAEIKAELTGSDVQLVEFKEGLSYAYPVGSITETLETLVQEMKAQITRREISVVQYTQQVGEEEVGYPGSLEEVVELTLDHYGYLGVNEGQVVSVQGSPIKKLLAVNQVTIEDDCGLVPEVTKVKVTRPRDYKSSPAKRHSCQLCSYTARKMYDVREHMKIKHSAPTYKCDECDYLGPTERYLKKHKRIKHLGIRYPCDKCDYKAPTLSNLYQHVRGKHEGVRYPCDECDYKATQANALKQHKENKHQNIKYPCPECDYAAPIMDCLRRHVKKFHSDTSVQHSCDECAFKTFKKKLLVDHKRRTHEEGAEDPDGPRTKYLCTLCNFTSTNKARLNRHVTLKHMKDDNFVEELPCDICDYVADSNMGLTNHKNSEHGKGKVELKGGIWYPVKTEIDDDE